MTSQSKKSMHCTDGKFASFQILQILQEVFQSDNF